MTCPSLRPAGHLPRATAPCRGAVRGSAEPAAHRAASRPVGSGPAAWRLAGRVLAAARRSTAPWALLAAAALAGCAQPTPTRFYTLMPDWQGGAPTPRAAAAPAWTLDALRVPVQVDRPQMVLLTGDGTLSVVERERWIAPLGDELRAALEQDLQRALGPPAGGGEEGWAIDVEVQRFESALGAEARLEARWTLRPMRAASDGPVCRLRVARPAPGDVPALATAHRAALARLADAIAASVRSRAAGDAACGAEAEGA